MITFQQDTVAKALFPIFMLLVTACLKALSFVFALLVRRPEMNLSVYRLLNVFMSLMFTFFNAIICFALILFKGAQRVARDIFVMLLRSFNVPARLGSGPLPSSLPLSPPPGPPPPPPPSPLPLPSPRFPLDPRCLLCPCWSFRGLPWQEPDDRFAVGLVHRSGPRASTGDEPDQFFFTYLSASSRMGWCTGFLR